MTHVTDTHVQCQLQRGATVQTSWLPASHAIPGKYLRLKEDGEWTNGWLVLAAGARLASDAVMARRDDYRKMRGVTDI